MRLSDFEEHMSETVAELDFALFYNEREDQYYISTAAQGRWPISKAAAERIKKKHDEWEAGESSGNARSAGN